MQIYKYPIVKICVDRITLLTAPAICRQFIANKLNKHVLNVYLMKQPDYYCRTVTCHPASNIR